MEQWKDIVGFEGLYQVSNLGRVRSLGRFVRAVSKRGLEFQRWVDGVVLRPGRCRGYLIVNLFGRGTVAVHILVAEAFVGGKAPGLEVNHRDGDKHHNAAGNLEWVTKSTNQQHAVAIGLRRQAVAVTSPWTGITYSSLSQATRAEGKAARNWPRA